MEKAELPEISMALLIVKCGLGAHGGRYSADLLGGLQSKKAAKGSGHELGSCCWCA